MGRPGAVPGVSRMALCSRWRRGREDHPVLAPTGAPGLLAAVGGGRVFWWLLPEFQDIFFPKRHLKLWERPFSLGPRCWLSQVTPSPG